MQHAAASGPNETNPMSAYIIVQIDTPDPSQLASYQRLARPTMREHNIRLLAKGPQSLVLEGTARGGVAVLLEADSAEAATAWYQSAGYRAAIEAREGVYAFHTIVLSATG